VVSSDWSHRGTGLRRGRGWSAALRFGHMTDIARRVMTPFAMAAQALPVVGTLEPGHLHVVLDRRHAVATPARGVLCPLRRVMVAHVAARAHLRHVGVTLVVERHREVKVFEIVEHDELRPPGGPGGAGRRTPAGARAQARTLRCGGAARMAGAHASSVRSSPTVKTGPESSRTLATNPHISKARELDIRFVSGARPSVFTCGPHSQIARTR